jgi:hypothetical protein
MPNHGIVIEPILKPSYKKVNNSGFWVFVNKLHQKVIMCIPQTRILNRGEKQIESVNRIVSSG